MISPKAGSSRVASVRNTFGGTLVSAYAYDPAGQVSNTVSAAGTSTFLLDAADRLETLLQAPSEDPESPTTFSYSYGPWNGLVSAVTNSAGLSGEYGYDLMDRPTNIAWRAAGGTLLRGFAMSYNAVGMVTNVNCSSGALPPETRAYAFDSLDRLVGERQLDAAGQSVREASYAYDLAGNRTQATVDGVTETYTLGVGNRLASCSSGALPPETMRTYTHDAAGCVTRIVRAGQPALDLAWDARYRLVSASTNGVVVEAYGYDPLGRRAWTTTYPLPVGEGQGEGVKTLHMYDGIHCVADLDASGTVLRSYTYGPGVDNLLAITDHTTASPTSYFALTDHLGTVHALVSSVGSVLSVVESYRYDAWGNVLAVYDSAGLEIPNHKSQISNRFLFQGREHSFATGLTHFRARWYDPATGRWLSNDPIGISGGLNQYVFCGNDPVDYVDPEGATGLVLWVRPWMLLLEQPPIAPKPVPLPSLPDGWRPSMPIPRNFRPPTKPLGNYFDKTTGESLRPHLDHPPGVRPHFDYKDPLGRWWRIFEDGLRQPKPPRSIVPPSDWPRDKSGDVVY